MAMNCPEITSAERKPSAPATKHHHRLVTGLLGGEADGDDEAAARPQLLVPGRGERGAVGVDAVGLVAGGGIGVPTVLEDCASVSGAAALVAVVCPGRALL